MNKIKAIIFDVGGVLELGEYSSKPIRGHREIGIHETIAKKLNISIDQWFDSLDTAYAKSVEGKVTRNKIVTTLANNNNVSKKKIEKIVKKAIRKHFKRNKQLFKHAFKLKKQGYKIAILSDQWYLSYEALMQHKFYKEFSPVVVSCFEGIRKPNPKIYKLILKKMKMKPSETIFIDNQKWNTEPAKKLGMKAIQFKDNKQLFKQLERILK